MSIQTVTGPIQIEGMGITLPHEHLFIDLRNQFTEFSDPEKTEISEQMVNINKDVLFRETYQCLIRVIMKFILALTY